MSFGSWFELIVSGLITGGIYALVGLGLNLQYGLMRILNIAHGEFLMLGAFLTWMAPRAWGLSPLLLPKKTAVTNSTNCLSRPTSMATGRSASSSSRP